MTQRQRAQVGAHLILRRGDGHAAQALASYVKGDPYSERGWRE